jgi:cell division septal protein FtsQ
MPQSKPSDLSQNKAWLFAQRALLQPEFFLLVSVVIWALFLDFRAPKKVKVSGVKQH